MPRRSVLSALALATLAAACGSASGGSDGATSDPAAGPDQTAFQVTWKPGTVVLDDATVKSALMNPTTTDGIYKLDPSQTQIAAMQAGQVLVLTGIDLVKVDSVAMSDGVVVVTTEPASLVGAATDADVTGVVGVVMGRAAGAQAAPPQGARAGVRIDAVPTATNGLSYNGPLGNLSATETMAFGDDGSLTMASLVSFMSGSATMKIAMDAVLHSFRTDGDVIIVNGALQEAYFDVKDIDMDLDFDIGAVALGASNNTFSLPVTITAPFELGPIPTFVSVAATLSLNPSLSDTSTSRTHAHFHLAGNAGVRFVNGAPSGYGSLQNSTATTMDSDAVSTVNAGLGVLLEFPKVSFGVGLTQAGGTIYASEKSEVVANEVMQLDSLGLISGNCLTVNGDYGTYVGGAMRLAGLSLSKEMEVWGQTNTVYQAGNPTDAVCQ